MRTAEAVQETPVAVAAAKPNKRSRRWVWLGVIVASLVVAGLIAATMVEEPVRRRMEAELNSQMTGYTVALPKLELHPFAFSLTLRDPVVRQQAHPKPPVMAISALHAGVHWRALLSLRLVADFTFEQPKLHINSKQLAAENSDSVAVEDKGWQDALESIYPLKINQFVVRDGSLTYVDDDPDRPLEITHLNLMTSNIRNIRDPGNTYPSPFILTAAVFGSGGLRADGFANFLAKPQPAARANIELTKLPLERLRPVANNANLHVSAGTLSAQGEVEYAAAHQKAHLRQATIDGLAIDYVHSAATAAAESHRIEKVGDVASDLSGKPTAVIDIDRIDINGATFGFVDEATDPHYRVFVSDAMIDVRDISNQPKAGRGQIDIKGLFMSSGASSLHATFLPRPNNPDVDVKVQIEDTRLKSMNDLFRAQGNFDVVGGTFSFFSELRIVDGEINGYVKPLFKDLDIYDRRQDRADTLPHQVYEGLVGGVALLLENRKNDRVATQATVKGRTDSPGVRTWEVVINLIRNAFFKAIMPGLESAAKKG